MKETGGEVRRAVIVAADLLVRSRLEEAARAAGVDPEFHRSLPAPTGEQPSVLMLDLDPPDALVGLAAWRDRWPALRIVGFVSHVDTDRRDAARLLGCEVFPRGATARKDPRLFAPEQASGQQA